MPVRHLLPGGYVPEELRDDLRDSMVSALLASVADVGATGQAQGEEERCSPGTTEPSSAEPNPEVGADRSERGLGGLARLAPESSPEDTRLTPSLAVAAPGTVDQRQLTGSSSR